MKHGRAGRPGSAATWSPRSCSPCSGPPGSGPCSRPPELARRDQRRRLRDPRERDADRRTQLLDARAGARGRTAASARTTRRARCRRTRCCRSSGGSSAIVWLSSCWRDGERRHRRVERVHEARAAAGRSPRAPRNTCSLPSTDLAEVVRLGPEQRLVDDRRGPERAGRVLQRLVQRLAAGQPADDRVLGRVLGGRRRRVERSRRSPAAASAGSARASSVSAASTRSSWTGPGGVGGRQRRARGQHRRVRRARAAGRRRSCPRGRSADRMAAVAFGVDRQAVLVDVHRDHGRRRRALDVRSTDTTSPTSTPGDPHRGRDVQLRLAREHRLEHERRARERQRPAEDQVAGDRDDDQRR